MEPRGQWWGDKWDSGPGPPRMPHSEPSLPSGPRPLPHTVGRGGGRVVQGAGAQCQACLHSQSPEHVDEDHELTRVRFYLPVQKHWTVFLDKHRTRKLKRKESSLSPPLPAPSP